MIEDHYELLYIIPLKFATEEQEQIIEKINKILKDEECEITKNEILGKQKLAYPIQHIHQGVYVVVEFDGRKSSIQKINHTLRLTSEVLRHLIIQKKKLTDEQIKEQQKKKEKIAKREEEKKDKEIQKKVEEIKGKEEKEPRPKEKQKKEKISLEDLDKKLDEILKDDIGGV